MHAQWPEKPARRVNEQAMCTELENSARLLPLPLEGYLDNTRFGATIEGLPHSEYVPNRGSLLKAPAEMLGSGPYITLKTWSAPGA